ncbi:MAG: hypothetical protein QXU20_01445 [Candidatus Woesearchaeota archaeon]
MKSRSKNKNKKINIFLFFVEKNQKFLIVLFSIAVILLSIFLIKIFSLQKSLSQKYFEQRVPISIIVGSSSTIFVNAQTDAFHLGGGPPGSTITNNFNITNIIDRNILVRIYVNGSIREWVVFSENNFVLKPGETKNIILTVNIPSDALAQVYNDSFVVIKQSII